MAEVASSAAETQAPGKKKRRLGRKWIVLAIVVLALALLAAFLYFRSRARSEAGQSVYVTENAETRDIVKILSGSGTLKPADSYTVTTRVEGDILAAAFEEGDVVEKDAVLYEIDAEDVEKSIRQAELSLEQAQISRAQAELGLAQSRLSGSQAGLTLEQAQRSYDSASGKQYVKADTAGVVETLNFEAGDKISAGQAVAALRDSSVMKLKVPFPSDDARGFSVGQAAEVTMDSTFETLPGTIAEISPVDTVGTGNMITRTVTVEVQNPGGISAGQTATASVDGVNCASSGSFAYRAESTVVSTVSGTVTEILAPEGTLVARDQAILTVGGDYSDMVQNASDSVQNAENSVRNSEIGVQNAENNLRNSEIGIRNAELNLEKARDMLDNYTIKSPISGTIVDKQFKAGDTISSAGRVLCTIYDLSYLEMTLDIDELDISLVAVGQKVAVSADAVAGGEYEGVITKVSVAGTTVNGTTSYPVTIRLDETEGLLPGMNVDAEIIVAEAQSVLSIPNDAVSRGDLVLITADSPSAVYAAEGAAPEGYVYVPVVTGVSSDEYVEILSGLTAEDVIAYIPTTVQSYDLWTMMMMNSGMGGGFRR